MPEGPPSSSTPRPAKPAGPGTTRKIPPVKPTSSTAIPRPNAPATRRTPVAEPRGAGPEVVVSTEDGEELSQVRQRVSAGTPRLKGLSLRWKIVIAMTGITVVTAILIFVVVYAKAVGQLNDEIDLKGVRIVKALASVDPAYWHYAINQDVMDREARFGGLLATALDGRWGDATKAQVLRIAEIQTGYKQVIGPLGPEKLDVARKTMAAIMEAVAGQLNEPQQQRLRTNFNAKLNDDTFQERLQEFCDPFRHALHPLKGDTKDVGPGSDILQISVRDLAGEGRSVQAVEGFEKGLSISPASKRPMFGVEIADGRDKGSNVEIRKYTTQRLLRADRPTGGKLEFNVILSMEQIDDAKSSLRTTIFLPIFVSVLLGTGIAIWISTLITEPLKVLMNDINQVSSGHLEHQTIPVSRDEIGQLAMSFNRMTGALREAHHTEIEAKAMEHDLAIASEIQSNLVPKRMLKIPGYDIGAYYRPSKEVGGDYYDFIEINEDLEGIIVADVSGKGVPGSLVMSMARAFIRMEAERGHNTSPGDTLAKANRMLAQDIKKGMFVTALYCILNKQTNEAHVASAGHNPLVVWRAATNQVELVNPNGIALGFDKGPVFERTVKEERVILNHGDRIVAYTDGAVEAMNAANQEFGDDRFFKLIQQLATRDSNQMLNLLVKALDEHKGSAPQSDDITIVTLRYL